MPELLAALDALLQEHRRCGDLDRYNIVSEDDLRMAAQKTTMYVDTLPMKRSGAQ